LYDIVDITDKSGKHPGLVLEYIDGNNLEVGEFKPDRKYLHTLWQIAKGLEDIHAAGIIHRDIKPANIRLDTEGVVKILDFGLARTDDAAKTRSIIGTPIFMAPELWGEETISFNSAIDVYAFGVTAVSLLSTKCTSELYSQPPRPVARAWVESIMTNVSTEIVNTIFACLNPKPSNRPTMADVQRVLKRRLIEFKHRGLIVLNGKNHFIDRNNSVVTVRAGTLGELTVGYDGLDYSVHGVRGDVFLNNTPATVGKKMPGCCVITFGDKSKKRQFVTFDLSTPEVMP
jgi:serine/threonine protein kinase